jgi:chromosome segregation protein
MILKRLELSGFKSFAQKTELDFNFPVTAIVGPNGSGKSNIAESFRFVLGEQSFKSMRGKRGEDMIFSGSPKVRRSNLAEICLVFNNSDRRFSGVDFDEVRIGRVVHRDGENNYYINGSKARLKDVIELLSAVHIGASAHHIISQGETDRILNAKPLERKSMIEEALGLKVYQYKRKDSEKKLLKTEENLKEVRTLRRELAPRIDFLKEQVAKAERARKIEDELVGKYREFLRREYVYVLKNREKLEIEKQEPERRLQEAEEEINLLKEEVSRDQSADFKNSKIFELEESQRNIERQRGDVLREVGRLEGEIHFHQNRLRYLEEASNVEPTVAWSDISSFMSEIKDRLQIARDGNSLEDINHILELLQQRINEFIDSFSGETPTRKKERERIEEDLSKLDQEKENKRMEIERIKAESEKLTNERRVLQEEVVKDRSVSREAERRMFQCMNEQQRLHSQLDKVREKISDLEKIDAVFKYEIQEAARIVGSFILDYKEYEIKSEDGRVLSEDEIASEDREDQNRRHKEIERLKILLEELSIGSYKEILDEYESITERDEFLVKEMADLEKSIESLRNVIADLEETIESRFQEGLEKINLVFQDFFVDMFGGGGAFLKKVQIKTKNSLDDEELDEDSSQYVEGLEIAVSLPRKNVRGLLMLSGGERALVSIALIFAMSQVNPPPFLILDETDAALDESNSQKYGALVEKLAEHSQLILITHNRETMARAGMLYGVTINSSGVSKTLSVRLGEGGKEK